MIISNLESSLNNVESRMMERLKTLEDMKSIYRDLLFLKDTIINISVIGLSVKETEEFDLIRFKTLELIYFTEMGLRKFNGISTEATLAKIEKLYKNNGENVHDET